MKNKLNFLPYFGKIQVDYGKMPMIRLFALQKLFYIMDGKARRICREKEGTWPEH